MVNPRYLAGERKRKERKKNWSSLVYLRHKDAHIIMTL